MPLMKNDSWNIEIKSLDMTGSKLVTITLKKTNGTYITVLAENPEIIADHDTIKMVTRRETYSDLISRESD